MRKYLNKLMEGLAVELAAGLKRLRKEYVDKSEALVQIIDPAREYPHEFVVYRLTGYRPHPTGLAPAPMLGKGLQDDLLRLMLDVCDSLELRTTDYPGEVLDTASLAGRFQVSTKTVQRWRRRGLPARRLLFPDGKRRVAFLDSSVRWFVRELHRQVARSEKFSRMTGAERSDIIRRARRMATFSDCTLTEVAKRLAARTNRVTETVRYTIRKHDREHPEEAVFPHPPAPLSEQDKTVIYRCFLRGVSVSSLSKRYRRSRGSIYRIVNEMRARQLLDRTISYIYNPQFDLPNVAVVILRDPPPQAKDADGQAKAPRPPSDLAPYLKALYDVPLLSREGEMHLFRRYNYLKYLADKLTDQLKEQLEANHVRTAQLKKIETMLLQAGVVKNQIIRANLRLVVSIARKHVSGPQSLFELISDGNLSLMRAAEKFDYSRGNRFSTYASWAIMRNYARSVPKERYQLDRFATGHDGLLEIAAGLRSYDPNEFSIPELRECIDVILAQLSSTERAILMDHYGLDDTHQPRSFEQLGQRLGLSKERVRQIEIQAIKKLRLLMQPEELGLLSH